MFEPDGLTGHDSRPRRSHGIAACGGRQTRPLLRACLTTHLCSELSELRVQDPCPTLLAGIGTALAMCSGRVFWSRPRLMMASQHTTASATSALSTAAAPETRLVLCSCHFACDLHAIEPTRILHQQSPLHPIIPRPMQPLSHSGAKEPDNALSAETGAQSVGCSCVNVVTSASGSMRVSFAAWCQDGHLTHGSCHFAHLTHPHASHNVVLSLLVFVSCRH